MACLCICINSCCKRSCQRQTLSYYYTQSLRESAIQTFQQQSSTSQHYILAEARMKIGSTEMYDLKPMAIADSNSAVSESITCRTTASLIGNFQNATPNTSTEQDIGSNINRSPNIGSNHRSNFMHSLFSIPSYERICFLPEHSQQETEYVEHKHSALPFTTSTLMIYTICRSLGLHIFVVSGFATFKYGGASSALSFTLCSISSIISAFCLSEFSSRMPLIQHNYYKYIYVTNGELVAYVMAINTMLTSLILNVVSCIAFSGYFESFLRSLSIATPPHIHSYLFGKQLNKWITIHFMPSLYALFTFILFVVSRASFPNKRARQKYIYISSLLTVLVMLFFIVIAINVMSYEQVPHIWLRPCDFNTAHCASSNANNSFAPFGLKGFFACCAINLLCFNGIFCVSKLAKYSDKAQSAMTYSVVGSTLINGFVYTIMMIMLLSMTPFQSIDISSAYSSVFRLFDERCFEALFSLSAMFIISYFQLMQIETAPIEMLQLSTDGLLCSKCLSAMRAEMVFAILCMSCATVLEMRVLIQLAAMMNLVSHILICGSILIMRYSHNIHEKYHAKLKEKENTESFRTKRRMMYHNGHNYKVKEEDIHNDEHMDAIDHQIHEMTRKMERATAWSHRSIVVLVWMYIIICILICVLVFYYDEIRAYHINIATFVTVFLCVVTLYFCGVFIYLHYFLKWRLWISPFENNKNEIFVSPLFPYSPLCGIILNSLMICSVDIIVSTRLMMIYGIAILTYYLYAFWQSKLYHINQKKYLLNEVKPRYRLRSLGH